MLSGYYVNLRVVYTLHCFVLDVLFAGGWGGHQGGPYGGGAPQGWGGGPPGGGPPQQQGWGNYNYNQWGQQQQGGQPGAGAPGGGGGAPGAPGMCQ